jgi:hypothetical protein
MGIGVLIIGASGTGKSTSIRSLEGAGIINVIGKPLPFRNALKSVVTDNAAKIMETLANCRARSIVIDDAGYIITNYYIRNNGAVNENGKKDSYKVFTDIAKIFWETINAIHKLPAEKIVYLTMHEDVDITGVIKPRTIGKMLDEKVCVEGMFSIVLRSVVKDGKYLFKTRTDGADVCKSPIEMFENQFIPNELGLVDKTIREYCGLEEKEAQR